MVVVVGVVVDTGVIALVLLLLLLLMLSLIPLRPEGVRIDTEREEEGCCCRREGELPTSLNYLKGK